MSLEIGVLLDILEEAPVMVGGGLAEPSMTVTITGAERDELVRLARIGQALEAKSREWEEDLARRCNALIYGGGPAVTDETTVLTREMLDKAIEQVRDAPLRPTTWPPT